MIGVFECYAQLYEFFIFHLKNNIGYWRYLLRHIDAVRSPKTHAAQVYNSYHIERRV